MNKQHMEHKQDKEYNIEIEKYEEIKELLKVQQEIVKRAIPDNLQNILNINKIESFNTDDINNCGIFFINHRKEILTKSHGELFIQILTETNTLNETNILKTEIKVMLELFLLQEILKQMINDEYFINKEYDTYLVYSYKNHEIWNYEINSISYLKDIPIFQTQEIKTKGVLPNDINKIIESIFPDYFIIPFNQKDFIEYTLITALYTFIHIPKDTILNISSNISLMNLYKEIFDEKLFKGVQINLENLYIKVIDSLRENKKEYLKIFTKQFDLKF